jgi:hypothetical protein
MWRLYDLLTTFAGDLLGSNYCFLAFDSEFIDIHKTSTPLLVLYLMPLAVSTENVPIGLAIIDIC